MSIDDDQDALAAEYVLGTLATTSARRRACSRSIRLRRMVRIWERRLGELN